LLVFLIMLGSVDGFHVPTRVASVISVGDFGGCEVPLCTPHFYFPVVLSSFLFSCSLVDKCVHRHIASQRRWLNVGNNMQPVCGQIGWYR